MFTRQMIKHNDNFTQYNSETRDKDTMRTSHNISETRDRHNENFTQYKWD